MRHVHCDIIKKWAETGDQVQFSDAITPNYKDCSGNNPGWNPAIKYRFKTEVIQYKRYLSSDTLNRVKIHNLCDGSNECLTSSLPDFIQWIDTEWKNYEIK